MAITEEVECGLANLRGTPVFLLPSVGHELRRIFGATYMEDQGVWLFPAFRPYHKDVLHDFSIVLPNLKFSENCQRHLDEIDQLREPDPGFCHVVDPFKHQAEGLEFVLNHLRCALFWDCGLGKTKTIVDLIRHEKEKALILAPVVGLGTWERETDIHSNGELRAVGVHAKPRTKNLTVRERRVKIIQDAKDADILVISYESAKRYYEEIIEHFPYRVIVADESHNLRDYRSAKSKCAIALASRAHRRILLSGTPTLGNPLHLYGQLFFLGHYIPATDYWTFRKHFMVFQKGSRNRIVVGYKNLDLLNEKVQRIAIRKTMDECLDLPGRRIIDVEFQIKGDQLKMYNELVESACLDLGKGELYEADHAAVVLQKLMQVLSGFFIMPPPQICDGCKHLADCVENKFKPYTANCKKQTVEPPQTIKWLKENAKLEVFEGLLDSILAEERNKVIVWCNFRAELDIVETLLKAKQIGYVRVDGSNSAKAPQLVAEFNADSEMRVYLAQIATGIALTINSAAYMVYFGLTYKLDEFLQSLGRNYRIGQKEKVVVYRLVARKSVLDFVVRALEMKEDLATTLTNRIDCALCAMADECMATGVKPFTTNCIYKSKMNRVITRPGTL